MSEETIKELFSKYGVKDLKDKHGQSECYYCKNIKHKFSLTWTAFLYEYKEDYYCYDCLLNILLQQENQRLKEELDIRKNHYRNKVNNQLAECLEPDCEDYYLAEIEEKAEERDLYKSVIDEIKEETEKYAEEKKTKTNSCKTFIKYMELATIIREILDKANIKESE